MAAGPYPLVTRELHLLGDLERQAAGQAMLSLDQLQRDFLRIGPVWSHLLDLPDDEDEAERQF
jgi:hypothetical protein